MQIQTAPLGQLGANFYIVKSDNSNDIFVIDPGDNPEVAKELISDTGCNLKYIILTHAHVDHIGALDAIKEEFDAPVVICTDDADALGNENLNLCSVFGVSSPETKADITVNDNDCLPFGDGSITFLHTPGHTAGSMCVQYKNALFCGDTLFYLSVGRCDFPGGSFDKITESIVSKIYTLDDSTILYPGHGETTTVGYEKANNPFVRG